MPRQDHKFKVEGPIGGPGGPRVLTTWDVHAVVALLALQAPPELPAISALAGVTDEDTNK